MSTPPESPTAPAAERPQANRYKDTLNLPKTAFPMKANLVQNEPATVKSWDSVGMYEKAQAVREAAGHGRFVFHDGPPYANGSLHLGHFLNKSLKDFVVRSKLMSGKVCRFVPGWDCHGLPIEHKVMTELAQAGKLDKIAGLPDDQRRMAIRRECQKHAEKYQKLQSTQLKRFLALCDFDHPYMTMSKEYEGATLEVFADLVEQGLVYRQLKAVHWSPANETALADAELEYEDREDISVYVDFEAADADAVYDAFGLPRSDEFTEHEIEVEDNEGGPTHEVPPPEAGRPGQRPTFMIWTTTPWTLPANLAIAVNPKFTYALVRVDGNVTVIAQDLVDKVTKAAKAESVHVIATATGEKLLGLRYRHPFITGGPDFTHLNPAALPVGMSVKDLSVYRVVAADYVTLEDGTGLVHTAPGHGAEDYATGLREKLPIYCPVKGDGSYDTSVPESLRGKNIWKANPEIVETLRNSGHLFYDHKFMHSYPHDWRGKTPVIFRATEQWFVSVEKPFTHPHDYERMPATALRGRAMDAVGFNLENPQTPVQNQLVQTITREQREMWTQAIEAEDRGDTPGKVDPARLQQLSQRFKWSVVRGVEFTPEWGRNRLRGMLESRPDWCISRQRSWGLPIPAFYALGADGTVTTLLTPASVRAVAKRFREAGSDAWFLETPEQILKHYDYSGDKDAPRNLNLGSLKKSTDIFDVWFESGSSWNAVMRERSGGGSNGADYPVELYLEGSDQHRGWFQLSLLPALGATGRPPFKRLLTHGFIVDKNGEKMSKSKGNTIEVEDMLKEYGADVCRWWVATVDYTGDIRADKSYFGVSGEAYRKVRNTLRFMLSNLDDFKASDPSQGCSCAGFCVPLDQLAPTSLEAWVLRQYDALSERVRNAYDSYDFRSAATAVFDFCNDTLSSVYLAAVKDRLYCDKPDSPRRRRTQTVLWDLTDAVCRLIAPILPHTADEAYRTLLRTTDAGVSVHLKNFVTGFGVKPDAGWDKVMAARDAGLKALESTRQTTDLDNPLDAGVTLPDPDGTLSRFDPVDLADLMGVSRVTVDRAATAPSVTDLRAQPRCDRSWKRDGTVKQRSDGGVLSDRDAAALGV